MLLFGKTVSSKYPAGYEWGNSYFSYVAGPVLFVHLNPYSYSNSSSSQYDWLLKTLQGVNRKVTPWMVVSACLNVIVTKISLCFTLLIIDIYPSLSFHARPFLTILGTTPT